MKSVVIIPARMSSKRFPGKPLCDILGIKMIKRAWNIASSSIADYCVVATDSTKIQSFCFEQKINVIMTGPCSSGTDRVCEAWMKLDDTYEVIVNLQCDAILTPPFVISSIIKAMQLSNKIDISTPMVKLQGLELNQYKTNKDLGSTTGTSVVFNSNKYALYFSKTFLPHIRFHEKIQYAYKHIGVYAYRSKALLKFSSLPISELEKIEGLEQLRALENGINIKMVEVDYKKRSSWSVDELSDVKIVEDIISKDGELF